MSAKKSAERIEPTDQPEPPSVAELSYEEARAELIEVVRKLETGGTTLEDSLALWERGEDLARACQELIDGARERLDAARDPESSPPSG
ncbi:MAG: exodeoxyribonuclease VII small subunit [Nocardioides sp.]